MLIPAWVGDFDEPNPCLGEASGHQALAAEGVASAAPFLAAGHSDASFARDAIQRQCLGGLIGDVHYIRDRSLHPESQFERFDQPFELLVWAGPSGKVAVERLHEIQLL